MGASITKGHGATVSTPAFEAVDLGSNPGAPAKILCKKKISLHPLPLGTDEGLFLLTAKLTR